MIADTLVELHATADRIGHIGTENKRALAINAGAVECDRYTFIAHLQRLRAAGWR